MKSGSIVLFHNDLENTTEALPQILEQLSQKGYEFVPVSELIYTENYTIDPNGMQIPIVQSNAELTPENVDEVMAQYWSSSAARVCQTSRWRLRLRPSRAAPRYQTRFTMLSLITQWRTE